MESYKKGEIVSKKEIGKGVFYFSIYAPELAKNWKPGQFIMLMAYDKGERIPLTITDTNKNEGTIDLIVQTIGKSTTYLCQLQAGHVLPSLTGLHGQPSEIEQVGKVVFVGGGTGTAVLRPIIREFKNTGNFVISIIGAQNKDRLILVDDIKNMSDIALFATDDGSFGQKGFTTDILRQVLTNHKDVKLVFTAGPHIMMKIVSEITAQFEIHTIASLAPIMIDGTGMCGGCYIKVDKDIKCACDDGPDFNAHSVSWNALLNRQTQFIDIEKEALKNFNKHRHEHSHSDSLAIVNKNVYFDERFQEVDKGFSEEKAIAEASRCLQCKKSPCQTACPVNVDISTFINHIQNRQYEKAKEVILDSHPFPRICGRVCQQEIQCQSKCVLNKKGRPLAIGKLERFAGDNARLAPAAKASATGKRVAVVGSGPSGLVAAYDLQRKGIGVTIFEGLPDYGIGGVLAYGIPKFRLPKEIVHKEIDALKNIGVTFKAGCLIGKNKEYDICGLLEDFDAIYIATGAGKPKVLGIPGENDGLIGICSSNEYLSRVNLMNANDSTYDTPILSGRNIVVIGGGNAAMDTVRVCLRMNPGASVNLFYRRTRKDMPAREEEIEAAEQENFAETKINFHYLVDPVRFVSKDSKLTGIECQKMAVTEQTNNGRNIVKPVKDSNFIIPCDLAIVAIGTQPNQNLREPELCIDKRGYIEVDEHQQTSIKKVFAGGDVARGNNMATVIMAMGTGRKAAAEIYNFLHI